MEEAEFKAKLTPEQYRVMREKGTETPHTGKYWDHDEMGAYTCGACGNILFLSLNKFDAESGWPAFTKPASKNAVALTKDGERTEVSCKKCSSHLGYLVDGEKTYYQINSIALDFQELPDIDWDTGDDGNGQQQSQQSSTPTKTISLTIGGLTIGAVLGAGAMWAATPAPTMCTPTAAQTTTGATAPQLRPALPAPGAIGGTKAPAQGAVIPSGATSSSAGAAGSVATTTP